MASWAAALALVAGVLHLVLAPDHLAASRGQGLFFLALAVGQIGWVVTWLRRPTAAACAAGLAFVVVLPLAIYVASRIIAPPFSDSAEGVDILGLATALAEAGAGIFLGLHALRSGFAMRRLGPVLLLVAAVGAGILAAGATYGIGLAAETVPWLNEPEAAHHHEAEPHAHASTRADPSSPLASWHHAGIRQGVPDADWGALS